MLQDGVIIVGNNWIIVRDLNLLIDLTSQTRKTLNSKRTLSTILQDGTNLHHDQ
jgi:hypothetical protein